MRTAAVSTTKDPTTYSKPLRTLAPREYIQHQREYLARFYRTQFQTMGLDETLALTLTAHS